MPRLDPEDFLLPAAPTTAKRRRGNRVDRLSKEPDVDKAGIARAADYLDEAAAGARELTNEVRVFAKHAHAMLTSGLTFNAIVVLIIDLLPKPPGLLGRDGRRGAQSCSAARRAPSRNEVLTLQPQSNPAAPRSNMPPKKAAKSTPQFSVIANQSYGLYVGLVESFDPVNKVAIVGECRHVARWYGKTGGITSLAAHGLCGSQAGDSRIGAPAPGLSTLTGIVNVFPCSTEARATFEAAKQS